MRDERVTYVAGHPLYKTLVGGVAQWLDSRSVAGRLYLHDLRVIYGSNVIGGFRGGGVEPAPAPPLGDGLTPSLTVLLTPSPFYLFKHVKHGIVQIIQNSCHQWLSDSFRPYQIRFRPGLGPGPWGCWRSLQRCSTP